VAAAALLLLGLFSTEIGDPDFWWHLKTGQYIVTHHQLPVPDPFAFTTASAPPAYPDEEATRRFNLTHEWLAQAIWYLVYKVGGFGGLVLWKALLLTGLCGLTGLMARRRTGSWLWGIGAALATASLAVEYAKDRPSILTYLFVAAFIAIFEDRRRLWLIPVLSLIWANCHGGFFLGWVVCAAYAVEALIRRVPDLRRVLIVSGLAVLLSGLNPNWFAAVTTVLRYRQSPLQATLIEWRGAFDSTVQSPTAFYVLLFGGGLMLLVSWKRARIADWILFAAFAAAAITAFRNELLVGLFAPVLIAAYFPMKKMPRRLPAYAPVVALVALGVVVAWGRPMYQLRAAEWRYPAGATAFLAAHHVNAPLFNTYEYGGYLIWKGFPVFIDGRALSESVFQDYRVILAAPSEDPGRFSLLNRYNVSAMLIDGFEYNGGTFYPLVRGMLEHAADEWKLVYIDPESLVFLRNPPPDIPALDKRRVFDQLDAACRLHIEHDPDLSLCARTLGDYYLRANDRERARDLLKLYLEHPYPGDTDAASKYLDLIKR
jgi:hypothetical protein